VIRPLEAADTAAFQALRLRGLRESPEAFGSTYEEEAGVPVGEVAARLARGAGGEDVVFGAVDGEGVLVGVAGLRRDSHRKARHRAHVWGMYVAPEARGRGLGRALLESLIAHARTLTGVERLTLSVVPENHAARSLYLRLGFVAYGLEPEAYCLDGEYWDSEHMALVLRSPAAARY
jgi:RimJ/RimL family protein N-acetyltransferase